MQTTDVVWERCDRRCFRHRDSSGKEEKASIVVIRTDPEREPTTKRRKSTISEMSRSQQRKNPFLQTERLRRMSWMIGTRKKKKKLGMTKKGRTTRTKTSIRKS